METEYILLWHTQEVQYTDWDCPKCGEENRTDDGVFPDNDVKCSHCGAEFHIHEDSNQEWL